MRIFEYAMRYDSTDNVIVKERWEMGKGETLYIMWSVWMIYWLFYGLIFCFLTLILVLIHVHVYHFQYLCWCSLLNNTKTYHLFFRKPGFFFWFLSTNTRIWVRGWENNSADFNGSTSICMYIIYPMSISNCAPTPQLAYKVYNTLNSQLAIMESSCFGV